MTKAKKKTSMFNATEGKSVLTGTVFAQPVERTLYASMPAKKLAMLLSNAQWAVIKQLPDLGRAYAVGRRPTDNREILSAVLWVMKHRARWQDLPANNPSPRTCQRRLRQWQGDGTWDHIWKSYLKTLDEEELHQWAELYVNVFQSGSTGDAASISAEARIGRPPFWWSMVHAFWKDLRCEPTADRQSLIRVFISQIKPPNGQNDTEAA